MRLKKMVLPALAAAMCAAPCGAFAQEETSLDAAEEVFGVDESAPPLVEFTWKDDLSNGPVSGLDKLAFTLVSNTDEQVTARASLVFLGAGVDVETPIGTSVLDAGKSASMQLPVSKFGVMSNEVSVQVIGHVVATLPDGQTKSYHSAPLFFHVDAKHKRATLYTEEQMIDEFNGGIVTGEDVEAFGPGAVFDVVSAESVDFEKANVTRVGVASDDELAAMEEDAFTTESAAGSGSLLAAAAVPASSVPTIVCSSWRVQFEDGDLGADYWESTSYAFRPASYAYAVITLGDTTKWSGYLDDNGCTPTLYLTESVSYQIKQYSTVSDGDTLFYIRGIIGSFNGSPIWGSKSLSMPFAANQGLSLVAPSTTGGWVNGAALTGWLMQTSDSGLDDGSYQVFMGMECPSYPLASCASNTTVWIRSNHMNNKFIIAHEIGHQAQESKTGYFHTDFNASVPSSDWQCRCDHVEGYNVLHCLQSREYLEKALCDGFAYFFSAKAFNSETGSNCMMGYGKQVAIPNPLYPENAGLATILQPPVATDCDAQKKWQENWCDAADTGVEWDWMNFFWEWHTGGGSGSGDYANRASMNDIYAVIDHAQDHDGDLDDEVLWEDVDEGAVTRFESPSSPQYILFSQTADDYGIIR